MPHFNFRIWKAVRPINKALFWGQMACAEAFVERNIPDPSVFPH